MKMIMGLMFCVACAETAAPPPGSAPWNGGKERAPFAVTSAVSGKVAEDSDVALPISITPAKDCTELTTTVRGIDGVDVRAGEARLHEVCTRGVAVTRAVVARVPRGGAGYVVVDVSGVVAGKRVAGSYSIPVGSGDVAVKTPGKMSVDADGSRVIVMPAEEH